jgi:hypothetical protein
VRTEAIRKIEDEWENYRAQQAAAGVDVNEEIEKGYCLPTYVSACAVCCAVLCCVLTTDG